MFQEFQNLPVPLIVLERVNLILFGLDEVGEHSVGQRHGGDGHGATTLGLDDVQTGFGEHRGLASVGVHV